MVLAVAVLAATAAPPPGGRINVEPMTPNASVVRALSKSHRSLVADLYWIRAIGITTRQKVPADGKTLIRWCRFVAELDPNFVWPYVMGGLLGTMNLQGTHYNVTEANELLAMGVEQLPDEPRLAVYLSFNQLELLNDVKGAALTLQRGARSPKAPPFMGQLATRLLAQTGAFEAARTFAQQLAQSDDPVTREFFQRRLLEIGRDEAVARAQQAVDDFRAARGHLPASLIQLSLEGFLPELPVDPLGGTLVLDAAGVVSSTSGHRLEARKPE